MLTGELPFQSLPQLHLEEKISQALQLMSDNQVVHLPVTEEDKFIGILSEDDLLEAGNDQAEIKTLQPLFLNVSVKHSEHFLNAIAVAAENNLSIVPVVDDENNLEGIISGTDLLKFASDFMSLNAPGGTIVLEIEGKQYSFTEISKLVETNDAQITQLNTSYNLATGIMLVTLRINKPEVSDIVATFQRYEYNVKYYFGEELFANELRTNYDNLMNYLQI